jgi:hypothetical protein
LLVLTRDSATLLITVLLARPSRNAFAERPAHTGSDGATAAHRAANTEGGLIESKGGLLGSRSVKIVPAMERS